MYFCSVQGISRHAQGDRVPHLASCACVRQPLPQAHHSDLSLFSLSLPSLFLSYIAFWSVTVLVPKVLVRSVSCCGGCCVSFLLPPVPF